MIVERTPAGPFLNIDRTRQPILNHRSGWAYALQALAPLHDPRGILLDSFIERTFSWFERTERRQLRIPYREPWLGILHNPPGVPQWHDYQNSPQAVLARDSFRESLSQCAGVFTLSKYLRDWLAPRITVQVCSLVHPTETPRIRFSAESFLANPRPAVIQIGWWLRRLHSIFQLQAGRYRKLMLAVSHQYFQKMLRRERSRILLTEDEQNSVAMLPFTSNDEYDMLLARNIAFCHLIDSSANNVVIECIVRNTPLLINRLPAVEEYLGRDYPFYFSTLDEASSKLERPETALAAHEYLRNLPKDGFSQAAFREAFLQSDICRTLSSFARSHNLPAARTSANPEPKLSLELSRDLSGTIYVERADFDPGGAESNHCARQAVQSVLSGLPIAAVRQLTLEDFRRCTSPDMEGQARLAYDALKRKLDQL